MKVVKLLFAINLLMACLFTTSCQRSNGEVWEDTKSAGRYTSRAVGSLGGKHGDSRQVQSRQQFGTASNDQEFTPLKDEDLYRQIGNGDPNALGKINSDTAIPQSKDNPGELGSGIPGIDGFQEPTSGELAQIFKKIQFATDDYVVRGQTNLAIVSAIADYLKQHPQTYVFVAGYCDERGPAAYNLALGSRRSNSVRNELVKQGVDLNHVFTISYGKERPIALGVGEEFWQQNRRAQFKTFEKQ